MKCGFKYIACYVDIYDWPKCIVIYISYLKLKHYDHDGRAKFIIFCTHKKIPLLTNNGFRGIVIDSISRIRNQYKIKLLGFVIMPEHIHLVVVPPEDLKLGSVTGKRKPTFQGMLKKVWNLGIVFIRYSVCRHIEIKTQMR